MTGKMLTGRELAERWGLSTKTLDRWRNTGDGPPYLKFGRAVRYRMEDVIEFEQRAVIRKTGRRKALRQAVNVAEDRAEEAVPAHRLYVRDVLASLRGILARQQLDPLAFEEILPIDAQLKQRIDTLVAGIEVDLDAPLPPEED